MASSKRKRPDNADGSDRPSPHRPSDLDLARRMEGGSEYSHNSDGYSGRGQRGYRGRGRGGRRGSMQAASPTDRNGDFRSHRQEHSRLGGEVVEASQTPSHTSQSNIIDSAPTSQAQNGSTPIPAPSTIEEPPDPPQDLPAFDFKIITKEVAEAWQTCDQQEAISSILEIYKQSTTTGVYTLFTEIIYAGLEGRIGAIKAGELIKGALEVRDQNDSEGSTAYLDTLSTIFEQGIYHGRMRATTLSTGISADLMRELLDEPLLLKLGLIRPTFGKMFIRKQTNTLYRQSNYNLLREESEGYSKLLAEFFTTTSNLPPSGEVVESAFERFKALIGAFDLDAGRVLDVTLDVFANLLVKYHRFFIKFLRVGSFWPEQKVHSTLQVEIPQFGSLPVWAVPGHPGWSTSEEERANIEALKDVRDTQFWAQARSSGIAAYFSLGGRRVLEGAELLFNTENPPATDDARDDETREWIKATKTLPPQGNSVAAQLMGFKLRYYNSMARRSEDSQPDNLIWLAALLIKIGFISLRDLYAHLYPLDDKMEEVKQAAEKDKEAREKLKRPNAASSNALAMAGALVDDEKKPEQPVVDRLRRTGRAETPTRSESPGTKGVEESTTDAEPEVEELPLPDDQKVLLLNSLLCIGALPEALYMLGRFPWLTSAFPSLADHINRILHHALSQMYKPLLPLEQRETIRASGKLASLDPTSTNKTNLKLYSLPPAKQLRWPRMDKRDVDDGFDYKFYFDDWADNIPVCRSVDDVFTLCRTFLSFNGPKIGKDSSLLVKLIRIGKQSLDDDFSSANQERWLDLCRRLLCPALSVCGSDSAIVDELWDILRRFPTRTRFTVYAEWFTGPTARKPDLVDAFNLTRYEARSILKRMNKENVATYARKFAKVSCASPGVVFEVCLNQIESYDNLSDLVVECGRFFTNFTYDVLSWSILRALGTTKAGRSRIADTGFTTSKWLQNLSKLCAGFFKRYPVMTPLPVLEYVLDQLNKDNFSDLLILKDMVTAMSGINPSPDFTEAQVEAMAGGDYLKTEIMKQISDHRYESRATSKRMIAVLRESKLMEPFLIAIAQQCQKSVNQDYYDDLKIIGENYDELHSITFQYLEMLLFHTSQGESELVLPDIASLISKFGLMPSVAFAIHRKRMSQKIEEHDMANAKEKIPADVEMKDVAAQIITNIESPEGVITEALANANVEVEAASTPEPTGTSAPELANSPPAGTRPVNAPWHQVLVPVIENVRSVMPETFEKSMSLEFYVTFWQLSLPDMMASAKSYSIEMSVQSSKKQRVLRDRSDMTAAGLKKKEKEKKEIEEYSTKLTEEMKGLVKRYGTVRNRLHAERTHWFSNFRGRHKELAGSILTTCFIPRFVISPMDALYTSKMLFWLHSNAAANFSTMHLLDALLSERTITNIIYRSSTREADNFGRFLYEVLREMSGWHSDRAVYEKNAYGQKKTLAGFAQGVVEGKPTRFLDFEEFRRLLFKWHRQVHESLKANLGSVEYMHIINAICVLRRVSRVFPAVNFMGKSLIDTVNKVVEREGKDPKNPDKIVREDLTVAASSVLSHLKSREKAWVLPQAFHMNDASQRNQKTAQQSASVAQSTPSVASSANPLNPVASEFAPKLTGTTDMSISTTTAAKGEVEDGELQDSEMKDAPPVKPALNNGSEKTDDSVADSQVEKVKDEARSAPDKVEKKTSNGPRADIKLSDVPTRPTPLPSNAGHRQWPQSSRNPSASSVNASGSASTNHALPSRPDPPNRSRIDPNLGRLERPADLLPPRQSDRRQQSPSTSGPNAVPVNNRDLPRDPGPGFERPPRQLPDDSRGPPPRRETRSTAADRPSMDRPSRLSEYEGSAPSRPSTHNQIDTQPSYAGGDRSQTQAPSQSYHRGHNFYHDPESRSQARSRPPSPGHDGHGSYAAQPRRDDRLDRAPPPASSPAGSDVRMSDGSYQSESSRSAYGYGLPRRLDPRQTPSSRTNMDRPPFASHATDDYRGQSHMAPSSHLNARKQQSDGPAPANEVSRSHRGTWPDDRSQNDGRMSAPPAPPASRPTQIRRDSRSDLSAAPPASPSSPAEPAGIHPSRLGNIANAQVGQQQPSPVAQTAPNPRPAPPQSPSSNHPPAGPRSARAPYPDQQAPPSRPQSTIRDPPSGPSTGHPDRRSGLDDKRRFAGIQNTLDKSAGPPPDRSGDQGTGIRGRAAAQAGTLEARQERFQSAQASRTSIPSQIPRDDVRPPRDDPPRSLRETRYREDRSHLDPTPPARDMRARIEIPADPSRRDDRVSDREYRKRDAPADRRHYPEDRDREARAAREPRDLRDRSDRRELFPASGPSVEERPMRRAPLPAQEDAFNGPQSHQRPDTRSYGGSVRGTKRGYPEAEGEERKRLRRSGP